MPGDWLLVETLGDEPVVAAQGRQMKNFVPLATFLRRNPNLVHIRTAVADTVAGGSGLTVTVPAVGRTIRTEPVVMTDGRIHGVQVWIGPDGEEPPERPLAGPFMWDLTTGSVTDSDAALLNGGFDPAREVPAGRAFAEDVPHREILHDEAKVLSLMIDAKPDQTVCSSWEFTDQSGGQRRVGFVLRTAWEEVDGAPHVILRAINVLGDLTDAAPENPFSQRVIDGLSRPGVHRAIVDIHNRQILKWLDEPCPFLEWRGRLTSHPEDHAVLVSAIDELDNGSISRVVRLPGTGGDWQPTHVTVSRLEVTPGVYAALISFRLPTDAELGD